MWRHAFEQIWARAEERGEVRPGLAGSVVAETTSALLVQRWLLTGEPVDDAYADEVLDTVVLPLIRAGLTTAAPDPLRRASVPATSRACRARP